MLRGRGPLKTTMDVINAAKKISEAGTKLDKLARQIADQVVFLVLYFIHPFFIFAVVHISFGYAS